jgi:hypothetical protein
MLLVSTAPLEPSAMFALFEAPIAPVFTIYDSSLAAGLAVPIPTKLFAASTNNVSVSTVRFPLTARLDNVPTEVMFVWAAVESVPAKVTPVIVADEVISPTTSKRLLARLC